MNIWRFICERFSLKATIPMTAILCLAPYSLVHPYLLSQAVIAFITVFLSVLCIRMADDIASIQVDRQKSPQRGLPSGRIDPRKLTHSIVISVLFVLVINLANPSIYVLIIGLLYYVWYFKIADSLNCLIKPWLFNSVFGIIPIYISCLGSAEISIAFILLGLFIYLGVVAHDFAHSTGEHEPDHGGSPARHGGITPNCSARLSVGIYLMAFVLSLFFWGYVGKPTGFIWVLMLTTIHIIYLEIVLLKAPVIQNARRFYIPGFLFFLLPLLALMIDNAIRFLQN